MPSRAALITFDDGFSGVFENALPLLDELNIPSVIFMNMHPQVERSPMLSALVTYLIDNCKNFREYVRSIDLGKSEYLMITPEIMTQFESNFKMPELNDVIEFQGELVDADTMKFWDKCENVYYGNHLFDHWNAAALNKDQLQQQYLLNEKALEAFDSAIKFFAFTNGKPDTCFSKNDVKTIEDLGARKVFSSVHGCNEDSASFVLGRVFTNELDTTFNTKGPTRSRRASPVGLALEFYSVQVSGRFQ